MKEPVLNMENAKVGEVDLDDAIFGLKPKTPLIYETVRMQLAGRRSGTAWCKNRGEVSGTTAKMYRQKGTGRARHCDAKANIFVGGGKAFGPRPRDYSYRLPAAARRAALRHALSLKKAEGRLLIVEDLKVSSIKTRAMADALKKLGVASCVVVVAGDDEALRKSLRNISGVRMIRCEGLNVYDLMRHEHALITRPALEKVEEVLKP
ncbi:MAG: 50S ribosomal protein L4 [Proteobacteria bacterium]|nr:50S ribosomal protein L4 [Pseudomonadota bacterium]